MPARRSTPMLIRRPEQVDALVSPVRQEICDALAAAGPSTIAQVAGWLGRRPDTLYYHVQALARVGLVVKVGRVRAGRRFGAVYDVPGRPMRLEYGGAIGPNAIHRVIGAALRLAQRDFRRALGSPGTSTDGPRRNVWGGRVKGWVDGRDMTELNTLIVRLSRLIQRGRPRIGAQPHSFTYVLSPASAPARRRQLTSGGRS